MWDDVVGTRFAICYCKAAHTILQVRKCRCRWQMQDNPLVPISYRGLTVSVAATSGDTVRLVGSPISYHGSTVSVAATSGDTVRLVGSPISYHGSLLVTSPLTDGQLDAGQSS